MARPRCSRRKHVGKVAYFLHHGAWYIYYRDGGQPVRRRVGTNEATAAQAAAQINAQLAIDAPTLFSFTPISVHELRRRFLDHHEHVLRSSLATIRRYRTATQHLEDFVLLTGMKAAHQVRPDDLIRYLREKLVAPNGHPKATRRKLRDKGIRYILEVCRSLYGFAARHRHLPPYAEIPFSNLACQAVRIEDTKPVIVFNAATELAFFEAADPWSFPIHFTLAKSGVRLGELLHLLIEDMDLVTGWAQIRNKPELGWRIKTGRERKVPLAEELVIVLRNVIGSRTAGPVFRRQKYNLAKQPLKDTSHEALARLVEERVASAQQQAAQALSRQERAHIAETVWRDAGVVNADRVRQSFIRIATSIGLPNATCPKSWRHTFATLLQDANVDPLIRQQTLGHHPGSFVGSSLGMTAVYTHTRPETQQREIVRAMNLWPLSLDFARRWVKGA